MITDIKNSKINVISTSLRKRTGVWNLECNFESFIWMKRFRSSKVVRIIISKMNTSHFRVRRRHFKRNNWLILIMTSRILMMQIFHHTHPFHWFNFSRPSIRNVFNFFTCDETSFRILNNFLKFTHFINFRFLHILTYLNWVYKQFRCTTELIPVKQHSFSYLIPLRITVIRDLKLQLLGFITMIWEIIRMGDVINHHYPIINQLVIIKLLVYIIII